MIGPAALVLLGIVALSDNDDDGAATSRPASAPISTAAPPTTVTTIASPSTAAPTTVADVQVPELIGMRLAKAKASLSDRGLKGRIKYRTTARYPGGTVISQSRSSGAAVRPDTAITLVVAKAPPAPPPPPPTAPPTTSPARNCDPSYPGVCLDPAAEDYDCAGGSGNGPRYVQGPVQVRGSDQFDLDSDGDGIGCERD